MTVYKDEISFLEFISSVNNGNSVEIITAVDFQPNDTFTSLMKVSQTDNSYSIEYVTVNESEDILAKDIKTVDINRLKEIMGGYLI